jgi:parvulin-like peptidyl-prolyl isomerase
MKRFALLAAAAAVLRAQAPLQLPINEQIPPDTVVAKSDGKSITAGEIRSILASGDPQAIGMARNNPDQFLGSVFVTRYLAAEGEKLHLAEQSPLKEQLQFLRERILMGAAMNQIRESYNVPEETINEFYAHNQSRYEQAWIKVIAIGFCPDEPKATGNTDEDIQAKAKWAVANAGCTSKHKEQQAHDIAFGLVGKIRGGADFVKLVAESSEDPDSKATQGDFGLVTRDNSFKQEIKDATFALRDDDVSNPIRSGNFFYIIKIKEKTVQPLSSVHEAIIQELKQKHFTDSMYELQKRLKPEILRPDFFTAAKPQ